MITDCDFSNPAHRTGLMEVLKEYAQLPHIGTGLADDVKATLCDQLAAFPTTYAFLAFADDEPDQCTGVAVTFMGFTTFRGGTLLNIHDLAVREGCRGQGIGRQLLDYVAQRAIELGCCRVTLEVDADNPARKLYERAGFKITQEFGKLELF